MFSIQIKDLASVREAARAFVRQMDNATVFAFHGAMGAGKTTFIKALCKELGVTEVVNSPTFAIVNEYRSDSTAELIYHFDFYRINDLQEAIDIGASDYFASGALCFVEWPEKIKPLLPSDAVFVHIEEQDNGERKIELTKIQLS